MLNQFNINSVQFSLIQFSLIQFSNNLTYNISIKFNINPNINSIQFNINLIDR